MSAGERRRSSAVETGAFALLVAFAFVLPLRHAIVVPVDVPIVPFVGPTVEIPRGLSIGPVLAAALVVVWALAVVLTLDVRRPHPFHAAFALFFAFAAASYRWTIDPASTLTRIAILGYVFVLVVIAWDLLRTRRRVAAVAQAIVLGAFLVGIVGTWEVVQQGGVTREGPLAYGANPNELARWLVLAVPLSAGLLANSRRFGSGPFAYLNVAYMVAAPFMVLATGSRQGVVALLVLAALGSVALVARRRTIRLRLRHVAVGLTLLGATLAAVRGVASFDAFLYRRPFALDRLGSLGGRTAYWAEGLEAFREHRLRGVGAGAFGELTPEGMSADPHNTFVGVAAELGAVGVVLFALAVVVPVVAVARRPGPTYSSVGILVAFALFSTVAMLYNDPLNWLVLLLVLAAHSATTDDDWVRAGGLATQLSDRSDADDRIEPTTDSPPSSPESTGHPDSSGGILNATDRSPDENPSSRSSDESPTSRSSE